MTPNTISPEQLFEEHKDAILMDVRTPAEFEKGHIPNAMNFPLFDNEERIEVGTLYRQLGPDDALIRGLELVGPKMAKFVKEAKDIIQEKEAVLYCWRGGKRSRSMSWLFDNVGIKTFVVEGGYKSYRRHVRHCFHVMNPKFIVLGGPTGSGKTNILHELIKQGEQVIDLEGLANHKGSAFGWIGEDEQPAIEHFENLLLEALNKMDLSKRIWIENESRLVGKVYLPEGFWEKMKSSHLINIDIPYEARVQILVDNYTADNAPELIHSFDKIKKRLGLENIKKAKDAVESDDFHEAARIALKYYDKTYSELLKDNKSPSITKLKFETGDPKYIAQELLMMPE